jgi:hypothetical protein
VGKILRPFYYFGSWPSCSCPSGGCGAPDTSRGSVPLSSPVQGVGREVCLRLGVSVSRASKEIYWGCNGLQMLGN